MLGRALGGGGRRRHSLTCTGTTPAVTFPPTCLAHFAAGGEGGGRCGGTLPGQLWGGAACLQRFGLLKGEGAERSQGWKAKLLPILSSLTVSEGDGKVPRCPQANPPAHAEDPLGTSDDGRFADRSPQTSEPGSKAELNKTTSARSLWERFQHSRMGQEPALLTQPQEQDVFHSMCTCLPVGSLHPKVTPLSCIPAVSLPSGVTGADTPIPALGAVCRAHEKFKHASVAPSHATQP